MAGASTTAIPYIAKAMPNFSPGKVSARIACSLGCKPPPPAPWMIRNTTSVLSVGAKPHINELTVNNATPTSTGDYIFLTGGSVELGNWGTTFDTAIGPMLDPNYPNWFLNASMPAGANIQFKFIKIASDGTVTWENGSNHSYTVPTSGTANVTVSWQY